MRITFLGAAAIAGIVVLVVLLVVMIRKHTKSRASDEPTGENRP